MFAPSVTVAVKTPPTQEALVDPTLTFTHGCLVKASWQVCAFDTRATTLTVPPLSGKTALEVSIEMILGDVALTDVVALVPFGRRMKPVAAVDDKVCRAPPSTETRSCVAAFDAGTA